MLSDLQLQILRRLDADFPNAVTAHAIRDMAPRQDFHAAIAYLDGHGLVKTNYVDDLDGNRAYTVVRLTVEGKDRLREDGGLTAERRLIVVQLHEDTIKALLLKQIAASDAEPSAKERLSQTIKALPSESVKTVTNKLVEAALTNLPDAISMITRALGS